MLQTTLHELDWNELLTLLPVRGYTHPESLITSRNYNDSKYHWVLRNIDFNQWRSKEDPRVLYLTGQSSKGNLNKLLSYTIGKEKAAGYSVLSVLCSTLGCMPNVTTFLYIFLLELMHSYRETERTPIIRSFMGKLLENHMVKGIMNWKEEKLDKSVFLKYMYTVLGGVAPKDLLSWLKEAINFESQGPLLVLIDGLDLIEASNGIVGCVLSLIEHLQRRESKTKILLASSTIPKSISFCQNFLHIEYNKERKG